jgi:CheY-like chemotaxis protein
LRRPEPAVEEKPIHGEGTVLVVDDEPAVRTLIQRLLERRGFSVVTADDGAEALQLFDSRREWIVLAVLDLTMPKMGGPETLERLRAMQPGLPILLTSGYNREDISVRLGLERTLFLGKPFTPTELLATIGRLLRAPGSSAATS